MDRKTIFLFLLIGFSLKFFDAAIVNNSMLKNICYASMLTAIIASFPFWLRKNIGFVLPIKLICVAIVISIFMARYTWGQEFIYSSTTIPYAVWFVFFLLLGLKIPVKTIENVVLVYGLLYTIFFLFQLTHTGTVYFGAVDEFKEDRGIVRVIFPGGGVLFLSCFIAITRVTSCKEKKALWLLIAIFGLIITILQVTRQTIFTLSFLYAIHFLRSVRWPGKIILACSFITLSYVLLNSSNPISAGLAAQQKEDASYGKDYIRILSAKYYLTQFSPTNINKILGNGFFNDKSNYGKTLIALNESYGYYLTDVGMVEVYITFGLLAVLGYILIFIKSITIPLPPQYYFLKYYLWMVMLTCLTSDIMISYSYLITTVLVLYCYQRLSEEKLTTLANSKLESDPLTGKNLQFKPS